MEIIRMNSRKGGPLTGILFLVVGLGVATWGFLQFRNAKASENWPTVEGRVISSEIDRHRETSTKSNGSTRRRTKYSADIRYSYTYEGANYTSGRLAFGGRKKSYRSEIERIIDRYPVGKAVTVYVNPGKPATACLQPGATTRTYIPLALGVVFALVGLGVAAGGFFGRANSQSSASSDWSE